MNYSLLPLGLIGEAADTAAKGIGGVLAPIVAIVFFLIFGLMLVVATKRYIKVPKGKAIVVYGKGKTRIVTGGAVFIWPIVNSYFMMDLTAFQFEIDMKNVPNAERVPLNIKAMATCKISDKDELLQKAAGTFGTMSMVEVKAMIKNILEGHLRVIIGQTSTEEILSNRDKFNQSVAKEAAGEVNGLGCEISVLNIAEVSDDQKVIESLGKPTIAKVKAEASIKEAEQTRRMTIETTTAQREAAQTENENLAQIALAERDRKKLEQQYNAEVATETEKSAQAGPLAKADAEKAVKVAQVQVEEAETEARTKLQDKVKAKNKAELDATTITTAEAEKQKTIIEANATKEAKIIEAEGEASARTKKADAEQTALAAEGEGEAQKIEKVGLAAAKVTKAKGEAEADAEKAKLLAIAAGVEADLKAKAAGILAELTAQADGRAKLLDAYKTLTPEQLELVKLQMLYDNMPRLIEQFGGVARDVMGEISKTICSSMGSIDSVTVYDSASGDGKGGLSRFLETSPDLLFKVFTTLKASGMLDTVAPLLQKLGFDLTKFGAMASVVEVTAAPVGSGSDRATTE